MLTVETKENYQPTHEGKLWAEEINEIISVLNAPISSTGDRRNTPLGRTDQLIGSIDDIVRTGLYTFSGNDLIRLKPLTHDGKDVLVLKDKDYIPVLIKEPFINSSNNITVNQEAGFVAETYTGQTLSEASLVVGTFGLLVYTEATKKFIFYTANDITSPQVGELGSNGSSSLTPDNFHHSGSYIQADPDDVKVSDGYPADGKTGYLEIVNNGEEERQTYVCDDGTIYMRHRTLPDGTFTVWEENKKDSYSEKIESGTNISETVKDGVYRQSSISEVTVANGYPTTGQTGVLHVVTTDSSVTQLYYADNGEIYTRTRDLPNGTFGEWVKNESIIPSRQLDDENINTMLHAGNYRQDDINNATVNNHYPANKTGVLQVMSTDSTVTQVYYADDGSVYVRHKELPDGAFTDWVGNTTDDPGYFD